jgi:hypothetical protein
VWRGEIVRDTQECLSYARSPRRKALLLAQERTVQPQQEWKLGHKKTPAPYMLAQLANILRPEVELWKVAQEQAPLTSNASNSSMRCFD